MVSLQVANIAVVPIKSGVAALFVVMAGDLQAVFERFPDLDMLYGVIF